VIQPEENKPTIPHSVNQFADMLSHPFLHLTKLRCLLGFPGSFIICKGIFQVFPVTAIDQILVPYLFEEDNLLLEGLRIIYYKNKRK